MMISITFLSYKKTQRYSDIMEKVEKALGKETSDDNDPEYNLILDCNQLLIDIENEIFIVRNFIRDKYRTKFQDLDSLVHNAIEYASVVKQIGNEMDFKPC